MSMLIFIGSMILIFLCVIILCCLLGINSHNNNIMPLPSGIVEQPTEHVIIETA